MASPSQQRTSYTPSGTPSRKRPRDSSSSYEYHFEQNKLALDAAAAEHDRVLQNALRAQRILEAEVAKARQLEELQAQEAERQIAEQRVHIARAREEQARAEVAARAQEEELERRTAEEQAQLNNKKQRRSETPSAEATAQQRSQSSEVKTHQVPTQKEAVPADIAPAQPIPQVAPQPTAVVIQHTQTNGPPSITTNGAASDVETKHRQYLDIHQRLKHVRKDVFNAYKNDATLKHELLSAFGQLKLGTIGDLRREMRKRVTQLTTDSKSNATSINALKVILAKASEFMSIRQDATLFIADPPPHQTKTQGISSLFIFLLSIFSKAIINKLISEASESSRTAEPVGIAAITIFANADLRHEGHSMIDILLAKYHKACPILFGIIGSEKTDAGRRRLGWRRDAESAKWITDQEHFDRMTGLGAGYGALSLRDFSKARSPNPLPPHNYWIAMARLLNTPSDRITRTHCVVVKALVEVHVEKFIGFYGAAAIAVLRVAVGDFPGRAERSTESTTLATLREGIRRRYLLTL